MGICNERALYTKALLRASVGLCVCTALALTPANAAPSNPEGTSDIQAVAIAQQAVTATGQVVDRKGEAIIGANVMEKGTTNGTITDFDGNFTLKVSSPKAVLVISYIGYKSAEIPAGELRGKKVTLQEDTELMDEVVVIGYGTQKKGDVTSAVSSVKAEDFTIGKIGDAAELVKGKVAGLSIVKASGDPNATSNIMLRGVTTLVGSVSPLVLVDGVEGSLTTVAPENIASIDVLKDASAAAIYGTRGANGVIIITTKTGKREQHVSATYSAYVSLSDWYKTADFMDTNDIIYGLTNYSYGGYDTDWLKAVTRKAGYTQNHSLTLEGGGKQSTYSANVTYSDEQGIMRKSDSRDLRAQLDFTQYALNDILKFNVNVLYSRHKNTNNDNSYVYRQALIHNPSSPIYNEDGSYYEEFSRYQYYNPREIQDELIGDSRSHFTRVTGNITAEPIKGWKTNLMLSMKENNSEGETYYTSKYYSQTISAINGWASKSSDNTRSDNLELTSSYDFNVKKHHITALLGYSYLYNVADGFSAGNGEFPAETYLYNNLGQGAYLTDEKKHASMGSYKNDNHLVGFFGRATWGYADRYHAMVSVRREGSSKFGENHKWGTFPSASAGWTINREEFLKDAEWLDNLKLRVGYGVTGVIPSDSYLSQTTYNYDTSYGKYMNQGGSWVTSLAVAQNPNPDLKWETTKEWNFGLDWSVLEGRISGSIDLYRKTTDDLLYYYSVPVPPNMYSTTLANVGSMRNTGIEVMVSGIPVKTKDFEWNTTVTLSHNNNKLLNLNNDLYETDNFQELYGGLSDPISVPTHYMEVGHSLGEFWGLKSVGYNKDGAVLVEVSDGNGGWEVKPFDTKYNTESNRQRLGSGMPSIYLGWGHNFKYKNFDLSMQFTGQFGYKILNEQRAFYENNSIAYNRLKSAADWHRAINVDGSPYLDENGNQVLVRQSSSMPQGFWSDYLENGDFLKLSSLTLGYTIPLSQSFRKYINNARVYLSGQNLFCITGYSGLDPEVSNDYLTPGVDSRDKYPTIRSFTFGLNLNF
jgi:TonB-linked SusC/RagA family outer membrane protein